MDEYLLKELCAEFRTKSIFLLQNFSSELERAKNFFFNENSLILCQDDILPIINDASRCGIVHAKEVATLAMTIILKENNTPETIRQDCIAAGIAGLLHDAQRLNKDHPALNASLCDVYLKNYPLNSEQKESIKKAIFHHEDSSYCGDQIASALHDADKLQWGINPLNTWLWELCSYDDNSYTEAIESFKIIPTHLSHLKTTMKTKTGKELSSQVFGHGINMQSKIIKALDNVAK